MVIDVPKKIWYKWLYYYVVRQILSTVEEFKFFESSNHGATLNKLPRLFVQITNTWNKNDSTSLGEIWYPKCNSHPNQKASQAPLNNAIHSIHNPHES
jgi:hypothetical protein